MTIIILENFLRQDLWKFSLLCFIDRSSHSLACQLDKKLNAHFRRILLFYICILYIYILFIYVYRVNFYITKISSIYIHSFGRIFLAWKRAELLLFLSKCDQIFSKLQWFILFTITWRLRRSKWVTRGWE